MRVRALWKVPAVGSIVDNYGTGEQGTTLAAVDVETGMVLRAVLGAGEDMRLVEHHPETGYPLTGTRVPQWAEILQVLERATMSFSGFRFQHWDVGITLGGPVLFELNSADNTSGLQFAYGTGIYDAPLKAFLRKDARRRRQPGTLFPSH